MARIFRFPRRPRKKTSYDGRVLTTLLAAAIFAPPLSPDPLVPLPIAVPADATTSFELDATEEDLLGLLRGLVESAPGTRLSDVPGFKDLRTPMGALPVTVFSTLDASLARVLRPLKRLRIVTFASDDGPEPIEQGWRNEGARILLKMESPMRTGPDSAPITIYRVQGGIAAAFVSGGSVTAFRTVGVPDMTEVGRVIRRVLFAFGTADKPAPVPSTPAPKRPAAKPVRKKG